MRRDRRQCWGQEGKHTRPWQRGSSQEEWGRCWGNGKKFCGLRRERGPERPGPSSREAFDNPRQMFLCPGFGLEARTQVQCAGGHTSTGAARQQGRWVRCRRTLDTKPLRNKGRFPAVLHSRETDACHKLTASLPWRPLPNVEGPWSGGLEGQRPSWNSQGQSSVSEDFGVWEDGGRPASE